MKNEWTNIGGKAGLVQHVETEFSWRFCSVCSCFPLFFVFHIFFMFVFFYKTQQNPKNEKHMKNWNSIEKISFSRFWAIPAFPPIFFFFHVISVFCFSFFNLDIGLFFHALFHVDFGFHVFFSLFSSFSCGFRLHLFIAFGIYMFISSVDFFFWLNCFLAVNISFICSCCETFSIFMWFLVLCFLFIDVHCGLVLRYAVLCLVPVCVSTVTFNLFLSPKRTTTFWLRSKASSTNKQDTCHEVTWKSQWTSTWKSMLAMQKKITSWKKCTWKWQHYRISISTSLS